jgi:hypothetical protein
MIVTINVFRSGGLNEEHAVAKGNLGIISVLAERHRKTKITVSRCRALKHEKKGRGG